MRSFITKILKSPILGSLALVVLGILLIFRAALTIVSISYVIGGILIALGTATLLKFIKNTKNNNGNQLDLVYGLVSIILGIVVISNPQAIASIIPFVLGFIIVINSARKLQYSLELKQNENVLKMYDVEDQIEKTNNRKIWLKCGGFITIDKTEALVAIDVNSGKFIGKKNVEETVTAVNLEAAKEISKQIRLRDISGIIIIDFIDMYEDKNKEAVINEVIKNSKKDRSKVQVEEFTKLNLMELTRKHINSKKEE